MLIEITVRGITPLMLDKFTEDMIQSGPRSSNDGEELSPREQAAKRLYVDDKGVAVFPADNLLACIIDAGKFIKVGKRQLTTRDTTIVTSFVSLVDTFLVIDSKEGWRVDARGIVNPVTKGRRVCYRPIFDSWGLKFTVDADLKEVSERTVRELIDRAGRAIGIGVMRPSRKGRYGQFKVEHWQQKKATIKAAA